MQRYEQLHAEETATQRVKGQRDDPEESAMDRGRERPCGPIPPQMLLYLIGLTLPHGAVGEVDTNLMESPYLEPRPTSCGMQHKRQYDRLRQGNGNCVETVERRRLM